MGEYLLPLLLIVALIGVNALFVTAEFALLAARFSRLERLAQEGNSAAQWLVSLNTPAHKDRYIAVAQLGVTLASIGLGMYGEHALASMLLGPLARAGLSAEVTHSISSVLALLLITFMHIIFGEMIPKALALGQPERSILGINPLMRLFSTLFAPLVWVLSGLAVAMLRLLRVTDPSASALLYSSKELAIVTQESAEGGEIAQVQRHLIDNIFALESRAAHELMTPRRQLQAVALLSSDQDIHRLISQSQRSRFPVYSGDLDNILGVLHVKDFIRERSLNPAQPLNLRRLIRPLPSVASTQSAEELLALFKRRKVHAALVVDNAGATLGFITLDDLIEDVIEPEKE